MRQAAFLVVGSINFDLAFAVNRFPRPGEVEIGSVTHGGGGKGFNQAVALSRLGAHTSFVGAVGHDVFGDSVEALLRADGIQSFLRRSAETTGLSGIGVDATGQNAIMVALGANLDLLPEHVPDDAWEGVDALLVQMEVDPSTTHQALVRGSERQLLRVLNLAPNPERFHPESLQLVDVLIVNEFEFLCALQTLGKNGERELTIESVRGMTPSQVASYSNAFGNVVVAVTFGARGSVIRDGSEVWEIPAADVSAVDTVGAGDCYSAAFALRFYENSGDARDAAEFASVAAGLAVTKRGAAGSMPYRQEVESLRALQVRERIVAANY